MCTKFGEDTSFRSGVIAILVKLAPPFMDILVPLCEISTFLIIIDINCPENILQWFGSDQVKNQGLVRKSRYWT